MTLDQKLRNIITNMERPVFLIGAGVSVSSGIKTFRTNDGYWVDGFVKNSLEVHGNIHFMECESCQNLFKTEQIENIDLCEICGGEETLRPNILFFDEYYNNEICDTIYNKLVECDTLFIVGTSNSCHISKFIFGVTNFLKHEINIVEINNDTQFDNNTNYFIMESDVFFEKLYEIKYKYLKC